jgi:hypothetical protein
VQQRQHPDDGFVWMSVGAAPAPEQPALLGNTERLAAEPPPRTADEAPGGVHEHDLVLAGPAEEGPSSLEPFPTHGQCAPHERFYVTRVDQGPLALRALSGQETAQVAQGGQLLFDRAVRPGSGARPEGSLSRPHEVVGKCTDRGAEANRKSFYTSLPTPVSKPALLVKAKSQAFT